MPIVESGALLELKNLITQQEFPEIQCHAAGTLRNLAAEEQYQVYCYIHGRFEEDNCVCMLNHKIYKFTCLFWQAIVENGCLIALAEQLRDSQNVPESVLSEISAAMAVIASDGVYVGVYAWYMYCLTFLCVILLLATARKQIMELYDGNFYKILIKLTESPFSEVQYNCAGIIGHLAINGE